MSLEQRTRVEIFIPVRRDAAEYQTVTDWLAEELAYARGGSTLTTPFTGIYISATHHRLVRDDVHVLFCDFDLDAGDEAQRAELAAYLDSLRTLLMEALSEEEVWIVYHPVTRVGGP